jgi:hypothetical protein
MYTVGKYAIVFLDEKSCREAAYVGALDGRHCIRGVCCWQC